MISHLIKPRFAIDINYHSIIITYTEYDSVQLHQFTLFSKKSFVMPNLNNKNKVLLILFLTLCKMKIITLI